MKENSNFENWMDRINKEEGSEYSIYDADPILVERYKNYCTKELQCLIFGFRNKIKSDWMEMPYRYNEDFLKEFDNHFNIEKV